MTYEEACSLILREGDMHNDENVAITIQTGLDPGEARLKEIADAIRIVAEKTKGETAVDKRLMSALWMIAYDGGLYLIASHKHLGAIRPGLADNIRRIADEIEDLLYPVIP